MAWKATVSDDCISCGVCVDVCPEVFDMPDGEKARPKVETIDEANLPAAKEACTSCPVDAIALEET